MGGQQELIVTMETAVSDTDTLSYIRSINRNINAIFEVVFISKLRQHALYQIRK